MGSQRRGRSSTGEAFSKDDDKERREYEDFRRWKRQFEQQEQRQSSVERGAQATTAGKDDDMEDFEDDE